MDGPKELHDVARGLKGTFERTTEGLRRLQDAARRKGAPLRVSINTTVAHESLDALDRMVDVAEELGVDAIGLNHLMFSTPEEVAETVKMIGATDAVGDRDVRHAAIPGLDVAQVRTQVARARGRSAGSGTSCSTTARRCTRQLMDSYYTPGTKLDGRCLYPFLHARVSFSGKVFFCPFIRVEVGDLTRVVARRGLERRALRRDAPAAARARDLPGLPALLQGGAVADAGRRDGRHSAAPRDSGDGGAHVIGRKTLLVNPPLVNGVAFTRQGRCQEREEVLGTTKPPYTLALLAALLRDAGCEVRLVDLTAERRTGRGPDRAARSRGASRRR